MPRKMSDSNIIPIVKSNIYVHKVESDLTTPVTTDYQLANKNYDSKNKQQSEQVLQ